MTKIAVIYQVIFHYRISFYEKVFTDPEYRSLLFYGNDNPYNKNKSYRTEFNFDNKKLNTIFIPYGKEQTGVKKVMPYFPNLFFRLLFFGPDVILCEGTSGLPNAIVTFIYSKLFHKRIIWWSLGSIDKEKNNSWLRSKIDYLNNLLERKADAIFTYSTIGKEYFIRKGIDAERIFVGVNVINTNKRLKEIAEIEASIEKDKNIFQLLFVGAIIKEKKLEVLIDAFNRLYSVHSDKVKLIIVGDGTYYETIKEYSLKKDSHNIVFTGKVIESVSKYFLESDVFVLPGLGGLAISDAMVHGLPVIATKADGTEKDLINADSGFLFEDLTEEKLFETLELLYSNPELKEKLSMTSKKRILTLYSFDNYYNVFKGAVTYVLNN